MFHTGKGKTNEFHKNWLLCLRRDCPINPHINISSLINNHYFYDRDFHEKYGIIINKPDVKDGYNHNIPLFDNYLYDKDNLPTISVDEIDGYVYKYPKFRRVLFNSFGEQFIYCPSEDTEICYTIPFDELVKD